MKRFSSGIVPPGGGADRCKNRTTIGALSTSAIVGTFGSRWLADFARNVNNQGIWPRPPAVGEMRREKKAVALNSIFAAVGITVLKVVVGIATGSLGILSEAAHSGLDLVAAAVTYFSVRVSDKPADAEHQYGHGKVESFSAFLETGLLLLTCVWIVYEAMQAAVLPCGGDRTDSLGVRGDGHLHRGGFLAVAPAEAHRREV